MAKGQGQGFGLGLGKMKELADAFKAAQRVQEGAQKLQEELEQMEISGQDAKGLVTVIVSGNQEPRRVEIDEKAMAVLSAAELSAAVTEAMQNAYRQSTETMRGRMEELTSGISIPGLS